MAITRINNNQITDSVAGNAYVGVNAAAKLQNYSITSTKIANSLTYGSDLTVTGNLTVQGNVTSLNTVSVDIQDPILVLASGQTGTPAVDIGYIGQRGTSTNVAWVWKESAGQFVAVYTSSQITNTTVAISSYAAVQVGNLIASNANFTGTTTLANVTIGNIVGALTVTGNLTGGNLLTAGLVSSTGNITGGNVLTGGIMSSTGNATHGNILTGGLVSATGTVTGSSLLGSVVSVSGNVTGGNVLTGGLISATGNVNGGNLVSSALVQGVTVSASGNLVGGNANITSAVNSATVSASGNITGGNVLTGGLISATSTVTGSSLLGSVVSASGNITGGNVLTGGLVSATGNVNGGNLVSAALVQGVTVSASGNLVGGNANITSAVNSATVSASGNITGGNVLTGGIMSSTGNATHGNILTGGIVSAAGNITAGSGSYFVGNGSQLTGISTTAGTALTNGTTNITTSTNGNANVTIGGTSNVVVWATTGQYTTGLSSVTGNIIGGNVLTGGLISATGNVNGGNLVSAALVQGVTISASGNVVGGNANITSAVNSATVSASGTITGGNLATGGTVSSTGNITGGNILTGGLVSSTGNITSGNILTGGQVSATGNLTGGNLNTNNIVGTAVTITSTGALTLAPSGNISASSKNINSLADPVQAQDAATKAYVDSVAQGLDVKASVVYATTANLAPYTYSNGTSGVGATLTAQAVGNLTLDGTVVSAGQRILIKNETGAFVNNTTQSAAFNGIYTVTTAGAPGTAYVLTRATDFDVGTEMSSAFTFVEDGSTLADTGWVCTTNNPITVGTTQILFSQFSGAGQYTGGNAISLTGTVINALYDGSTIGKNGSNQLYIPANAPLVTPNIGAATGTSLSVTGAVTSSSVVGGIMTGTSLSATGNVTSGNLLTGGLISATANITGGNVLTGGLISGTGNVTGGNVLTGGLVSATGNVNGGNLVSAALVQGVTVSASGNLVGGNANITSAVNSATVSASGNVTGGNLLTGGLISATSTVTGSSLLGSVVSASGNITGGNVLTGGIMSSTGNATHGNILTGGIVSATGNISTANYFVGNGAFITGISTSAGTALTNGTTNITTSLNGNANVTIGGTSNVIVWATTGQYVTGLVSANGNVTGGNLLTAGVISATGNITGNSIIAAGTATTGVNAAILGNVSNVNLHQTAVAVLGGNANSSVQFAFQNYSALSNASTDLALYNNNGTDITYYIDMGITSSTFNGTAYGANVYGANDGYVYVVGNSATGPVGSGANIGNLILGSTNGQVIVFVGNASTSNVVTVTSSTGLAVTGVVSASGNITGGNVLTGGLISSTGNVTGGNVLTGGLVSATGTVTGSSLLGAVVSASGNITGGNVLFGSGVVSGTGNINGNVLTGTTGNLGNIRISVDNITTVGSNLTINSAAANINFRVSGTAANVLAVDAASNTVVIGSLTATAVTNAALNIATTNSMIIPVGNTAQRPSTPVTGMMRYNTTQGTLEYYTANAWTTAGTTFTVINADSFTGNGVQTAFTLSSSSTTAATIVAINGVVQIPTTAYSVSGTTLTFTEAPSAQDNIDVRELTTTTTVTGLQNISGNAIISGSSTAAQFDLTGSIVPVANATANLGSVSNQFNTVFAKATSAQYADLAEMYVADQIIEAGTVVAFGGNNEVTTCTVDASRRVAGVVSTNPSYLMNSGQAGEYVVPVALTGRVPVRVTGTVQKGDMMVATGDGRARAEANPAVGSVIGKALADFNGVDGVIEVVVGRV